MNSSLRLMLGLIAAILWTGEADAQEDVKVSAQVSSERAFVGDPIDLEIVVDGSTDAQPPDLSGIDGFTAEYLGDENRSMTSMSMVNGRRSQNQTIEYVFKYALTPTRAGSLQVPPITVQVEGKPHTSQPVWIDVRAPQPSEDFILKVESAKTKLYVGEPATLTITWYISSACNGGRFAGPDPAGEYDLASPPDPRASHPGADARRFIDFTFLGNPAVGERGEGHLHGRTFQTLKFSQVLIPRKAGTVRFGPINLAFDQVVGQSRDIFDRRPTSTRVVIASDPLDLEVSELPSTGRPADFSGLVGNFSVRASASPTSASVGDPINLTVRIRGPEPMLGVEAPDLASQSGFGEAFKLATEGWTEVQPPPPGERAFSTTIRAKDDGVTEVPVIALPYFDPDSGEYRRAESAPIPLSIRVTTEVTAADAIVAPRDGASGSPGPQLPGLERLPLGNGPAGLIEGDRGAALLAVQDPDAIEWARSPVGMAAVAAPVLCFVAASAWGPARRVLATPGRRALAKAEWAIRRGAASGRPAEAVGAAVRTYVGQTMGRAPEAMTSRDCAALTLEHAPGSAAAIVALLEDCDGASYGGRPLDSKAVAPQAIEAVRRLDAELRSKP